MASAGLLDRLLGRKQQREVERAVTRADLVRQVLDKELTDLDDILLACDLLGMTPEQLNSSLADLAEVRRLQAIVADAPALEKAASQLQKQQDTAAEKFQAAQAIYRAELERIQTSREAANIAGRQAMVDDARRRLLARQTPVSLQSEEQALVARHVQLNRERQAILDDVQRATDADHRPTSFGRLAAAKSRVSQLENELQKSKTPAQIEPRREALAAARKHVEVLRVALHKQRDQLPAVEKEIEKVRSQIAEFQSRKVTA